MTTADAPLAVPTSEKPVNVVWRSCWLVWHQLRYDMRTLRRNREARVFTLGTPVVLLVLFVAIFGNLQTTVAGHSLKESSYYVANLVAFGIVDASFMAVVVAVVIQRERGGLRRRLATPEPAWVIVVGRSLTAVLTSFSLVAVLMIIGSVAYSASVPTRALPGLLAAVVVGTTTFCCLAFALTPLIRSQDAAMPVVTAVAMPLFFISGVFIPWQMVPNWLRDVAVVFPIRHLADAMLVGFDPHTTGSGVAGGDLAVMAVWGALGLAFAARRFSWVPRVAA